MRAVFTCKLRNLRERVGTGWTPKPRECSRSTAIYVWRIDSALLRAIKMMWSIYTTQRMLSRRKCWIAGCRNLVAIRGAGATAEGHRHTLVLRTVEHEAEDSLAGLADRQVHVEVRKVDLREVVAVTEDRLKGMRAFHLEVPIHEMAFERTQIDAPPYLRCVLLGHREERRP